MKKLLSLPTFFAVLCLLALRAGSGRAAFAQAKDLVRADEEVTKRAALVIGNTHYEYKPLKNPENDARDIAKALTKLGFVVTLKDDLTLTQMREVANTWADSLDGHTLALVYYSGHGITNEGHNYLVPVNNSQITHKRDVPDLAYPFQRLLDATKEAGCPLRIFILDACRNDPLPRGLRGDDGESGLAKVATPTGAFIAYAAGFGETASDNADGGNGLYTAALLKYIQTPGLPIEALFKRVRGAVLQGSGGEQHPDESSQLIGDFCFAGATTSNGGGSVVVPDMPKNSTQAADEYYGRGNEFWTAGNYAAAAAQYSLALDTDPKNADAWAARGNSYKEMAQYDKALSDLSQAIRLNPNHGYAYCNRGTVYHRLGQYDKTVADYTRAIQILPDFEPAYNNRGAAYDALKEYAKAVADYSEGIRLKPKLAALYSNRGTSYYYLSEWVKALADYRTYLELTPNASNVADVRRLVAELEAKVK